MILKRLLVVPLLLLSFSGPTFAERKTYHQDNVGGEVEETVYEEGDNEYRYEKTRIHYDSEGYRIMDERFLLANDYNQLGVRKTVKTFFQAGGLKKVEVVFRDEKAAMVGYERITLDYDSSGVRRRMEVIFTDDHTDKRVYSRSVSHYDMAGVLKRTIYYFTERVGLKTGYHRIVEQYNRKGEKVKENIYGRDGNEY